jgi:hypothetical protein
MTHETMLKIPSYLKGLVETRARADAYAVRLERLSAELDAALSKARRDRESCDNLIRAYNDQLDPAQIAPIQGRRGRYGPRGAFIGAMQSFIESAYPGEVTSAEVEWHLILHFQLDFATSIERKRWKKQSVLNKLQRLTNEGVIERIEQDDELHGITPGRWRWAQPTKHCRRAPCDFERQKANSGQFARCSRKPLEVFFSHFRERTLAGRNGQELGRGRVVVPSPRNFHLRSNERNLARARDRSHRAEGARHHSIQERIDGAFQCQHLKLLSSVLWLAASERTEYGRGLGRSA